MPPRVGETRDIVTLVYFEEIERDQYDYAATGSDGRNLSDGGMGLGLGIARGIIEAHGGALLLSNHPGGGLNAVIRLPA